MSDRTLKLCMAVTATLLLVANASLKRQPSAEEIRRSAESFSQPREWKNRVAPDFELTLLDGSTFRMQEAVGRQVVVLNFFATWCGPCRDEMPELQRYQQAHRDNGVVLIGVDAEERSSIVKAFVDDLKVTFPVGIDESGDLLELYDVTSFPTTIVVGADGRVKLRETGAILNAEVALDSVIQPEIEAVRLGRGIVKDAYLAALAAQPPDSIDSVPPVLNERAARIAAAMPCPCGCSDKVAACSCQTAKGIKARLEQGGYEHRTDAEVMEELNKEFCMKGM